jgi:nucleoside-diphosphate-sugar epimerase
MAPLRFIRWIDSGTPITVYGDGSQSRDFTYVDDIARGTILACAEVGYEIINLGGGRNPITLHTMISYIEKALNKRAIVKNEAFHVADIKETWADISKADRVLHWRPTVGTEEGFLRTVHWHVANRNFVNQIEL